MDTIKKHVDDLLHCFAWTRPRLSWNVVAATGLMAAVQLGAYLAAYSVHAGYLSFSYAQSTSPALSTGVVLLFVTESLLLIGLWRVWSRLPVWLRTAAVTGFAFTLLFYLGAVMVDLVWWLPIATGLAVTGVQVVKAVDLYWLFHNTVAYCAAVGAATMLGLVLHPFMVLIVLAGLLVWDFVAVDKSGLMGSVVEFSSAAELPNYFVVPARLQVPTAHVTTVFTAEEKPDTISLVVGVGDYALPMALLTSSVVAFESVWPALGSAAGGLTGMVLLVSRLRDEGVPGLPTLCLWTGLGFAVGYVVMLL